MIVLYRGARGRGKTLTMCKDALKFYKLGYRIISNMTLSFGENITGEEVLALNRSSELYDCVLVIDEMQLFFDSRNFGNKGNKDFSNFIQQIRKRNVHILFTTQYLGTVDLRIRQHIDVVCYPKFNKELSICDCRYFDITKLEDDYDFIKPLKPVRVIYDAKPIFPLFNTNEMLK